MSRLSRKKSDAGSVNRAKGDYQDDDTASEISMSAYRSMSPRPTLADLIREVQEKKKQSIDTAHPDSRRGSMIFTPRKSIDHVDGDGSPFISSFIKNLSIIKQL